jgi:hypothetical protein
MEHPFADDQYLPLEESNAFPADSALTPDAISSDPFQQSLSHVTGFDEHPFQDLNPFDSSIHHFESLSTSFNSYGSEAFHSVQPFDPLQQPFVSLQHSPSIDHSHLIADSHFQLEGNLRQLISISMQKFCSKDPITKNTQAQSWKFTPIIPIRFRQVMEAMIMLRITVY